MKAFRNYNNGREQSAYLPGGAFLRITGNLLCPNCHRVIGCYDFEALDTGAFEVICGGCHRTVISCKPAE